MTILSATLLRSEYAGEVSETERGFQILTKKWNPEWKFKGTGKRTSDHLDFIAKSGGVLNHIRIQKIAANFKIDYSIFCKCGSNLGYTTLKSVSGDSLRFIPTPLCKDCKHEMMSKSRQSTVLNLSENEEKREAQRKKFLKEGLTILEGELRYSRKDKLKCQCPCGEIFDDIYEALILYPKCPKCRELEKSEALRRIATNKKTGTLKIDELSTVFKYLKNPAEIKTSSELKQKLKNPRMLWERFQKSLWGRKCCITGVRGSKLICIHHMNAVGTFPSEALDLDNGVCLSKETHYEFHKRYDSYTGTCTKEMFYAFYLEKTGKEFKLSDHINISKIAYKTLLDIQETD